MTYVRPHNLASQDPEYEALSEVPQERLPYKSGLEGRRRGNYEEAGK